MKKKFYETLIKKINPDYIEESYRELIENWESIDYFNKFDLALSESCTKELMKKNNTKWNDTEIKFLITFMVNQYINRLPRKEKIVFTFPKMIGMQMNLVGSFQLIHFYDLKIII